MQTIQHDAAHHRLVAERGFHMHHRTWHCQEACYGMLDRSILAFFHEDPLNDDGAHPRSMHAETSACKESPHVRRDRPIQQERSHWRTMSASDKAPNG